MRSPTMLVALLALAACAAPGPADWQADLPAQFRPKVGEPIADAIQVWRLGAQYIPRSLPSPDGLEAQRETLSRLDAPTRWFLENPNVQSAVTFGCVINSRPAEARIVCAMAKDQPREVRLLALTILVRVHAPRFIKEQWKTLQDLKHDTTGHPGLPWLLAQLEAEFSLPRVRELLRGSPPEGRYDNDPALEWGARAAGVARISEAIPRLEELSVNDNLDASLAAVTSLAEIPGKRAERALVFCLRGWRYDAYVRAGRTLLKRNPKLLLRTLLAVEAPRGVKYQVGLFLGQLDSPAAVPLLCETVGRISIVDRKMFDHIERLATKEHLLLIDALPDKVHKKQRKRALEVRAAVRARLG